MNILLADGIEARPAGNEGNTESSHPLLVAISND